MCVLWFWLYTKNHNNEIQKRFFSYFFSHSVLWQRPLEDGGTCLLSHQLQTNASDQPVRKIQRLISIHSNTHFLSLLTSAPCPILVGTPFIYGKDSSFNFFFLSLFFHCAFQTQKSLTCVSIRKWLATKEGLYFYTHFVYFFFLFCFIHILQFHSLLFLSWRSWFTCHLCCCFCLRCCYLVFSIGFYFWVIPLLDPCFFVLVFLLLLFFSLNLIFNKTKLTKALFANKGPYFYFLVVGLFVSSWFCNYSHGSHVVGFLR